MTARELLIRERSTRAGIADRRCRDLVDAVAQTTALQAQDSAASYLGVRARTPGLTEADVTRAVTEERSIVRTWLMRGTIHLVATADLRWLITLIGPSVQRKYRTRWRQLGLTDDVLDSYLAVLPEILSGGPQGRHAIVEALRERGVSVDSADPQVHTHALVHASTVGLICRGPDQGRLPTFVLVADWVPNAPEGPAGEDALAELARRYFRAYSPATAADFTTWSGLPASRAIELIRDELTEADVDGRSGYRLGAVEPVRGVRLLPAFDNYVLGYRDRAAIVDPARYADVYQGGMIRSVVVSDGAAIGTWRLHRGTKTQPGELAVMTWRPLRSAERKAVRAEVADVGRFLGRELVCASEQRW